MQRITPTSLRQRYPVIDLPRLVPVLTIPVSLTVGVLRRRDYPKGRIRLERDSGAGCSRFLEDRCDGRGDLFTDEVVVGSTEEGQGGGIGVFAGGPFTPFSWEGASGDVRFEFVQGDESVGSAAEGLGDC